MGQCLNKCLTTSSTCPDCSGSGKCHECKGKGFTLLKDRTALRNEKRKDHQGNIIPEVINVKLPDEEKHCSRCGGFGDNKPLYRGAIGTASPVDYKGDLSPNKGRHGDGMCKKCKGTGTVTKPMLQPKRLHY
mmetsp:Transcript_33362/g.87841  ORF Transcript_33362/g.87841 Transcript_33362/m.87841 type:complete len:132 (+) Transcript_33362:87-482(+)